MVARQPQGSAQMNLGILCCQTRIMKIVQVSVDARESCWFKWIIPELRQGFFPDSGRQSSFAFGNIPQARCDFCTDVARVHQLSIV